MVTENEIKNWSNLPLIPNAPALLFHHSFDKYLYLISIEIRFVMNHKATHERLINMDERKKKSMSNSTT